MPAEYSTELTITADTKYLILKSKIQYRPTFGAIAKHIVECNAVGVGSAELSLFPYKALMRPLFPLDLDTPYNDMK
jgi:microcystin degradation protein MlrC